MISALVLGRNGMRRGSDVPMFSAGNLDGPFDNLVDMHAALLILVAICQHNFWVLQTISEWFANHQSIYRVAVYPSIH